MFPGHRTWEQKQTLEVPCFSPFVLPPRSRAPEVRVLTPEPTAVWKQIRAESDLTFAGAGILPQACLSFTGRRVRLLISALWQCQSL